MLVIRGHLESSQQGFSEIEARLNRQGPLKYRAWDSAFVRSSQEMRYCWSVDHALSSGARGMPGKQMQGPEWRFLVGMEAAGVTRKHCWHLGGLVQERAWGPLEARVNSQPLWLSLR